MALTHSQIVPAAFWVGFVALGLVTSLGAPQKAHSPAPATHSFNLARPDGSAVALDADHSGRGRRDKRLQAEAVQED